MGLAFEEDYLTDLDAKVHTDLFTCLYASISWIYKNCLNLRALDVSNHNLVVIA